MMAFLESGCLGLAGGLLTVLMAASAPAQGLGGLKPSDQDTELLGGRLKIRMPEKARVEARGHSIMAAPQAVTDETRVVLDAGKERLVLMAWELFARAGGDLPKAVEKVVSGWGDQWKGTRVEPLAVAKPLKQGVLVIPGGKDLASEAILALTAYVENSDGMVQMLAFYVNPPAAQDLAGCASLARSLAATLSAGGKGLDLGAGDRRFPGVGDKDFLVLKVPEGYVATTQQGPDFSVYRLRRVGVLGEPGSTLGLYLGGHPSYQFRQAGDEATKPSRSKGKLLGQEIEWHGWSRGDASTTETILPFPGVDGFFLHLFLTAAKETDLAALRAVAETLRIERK